jgi:DNA invertase Pin-like site-specific DNA recombinase
VGEPQVAGVYCRISQDRAGDGLGVQRQEADCRDLVSRRGWQLGDVYVDDDRSAFSGKRRPEYERLLADLKAQRVTAVVAWHPDRLHRSPRELEDFIDLVEANGAVVATVQAGEYDLASAAGRMTARVVGAVARAESEHKSDRIRRQREQAAAEGRFHGGRRPYGYESDGTTVRSEEAAMICEAAKRVLAGESVRRVAFDWNDREIPSSTGGEWCITSLRELLVSPRIAGRRTFRGDDIGPAQWPAIITPDQHIRLVQGLNGQRKPRRGRPPTNLLTSMVRCELCGATLSSSRSANRGRRYLCRKLPGRPGCGRTAIEATNLEPLVTEAVLLRVDTRALAAALTRRADHNGDTDIAGGLSSIEAQLETLDGDFYVEQVIDRARWLKVKRELETRREQLQNQITIQSRTTALDGYLDGDGALRRAWPELPIDTQRAILATLIDHITIGPARRQGRRFDPDRVDITWLL